MRFALALMIAVHFWHARNVEVPCHPVAVENADALLPLDEYGMRAPMGSDRDGCRILIAHRDKISLGASNWYCMEVVHEVGHLAGLGHTPTGLMAEYNGFEDMPYDCQHWRAFERGLHGRPGASSPGLARGSASARASDTAGSLGPAVPRSRR